ncbi:MAG: DUF1566 domain-containing protein [Syntrophales bacterium]|nr:DUF1566 domain-containing protein [Syntrophales bacterium]
MMKGKILNQLNSVKKFWIFFIVFSLFFLTSSETKASSEIISDFLKENNYELISLKVLKTGDIVQSIKKSLLGEYYTEYYRPVLIKISARCKPTGKYYDAIIETRQYRDKWGEWKFDNYVILDIERSFPKTVCETEEDIKKRLRKEKEEQAKLEIEAMLKDRFVRLDLYDKEVSDAEKGILKDRMPVLDKKTNLIWYHTGPKLEIKRENASASAVEYCRKLKVGKYQNWRLPTETEFLELWNFKDRYKGVYNYFSIGSLDFNVWVTKTKDTKHTVGGEGANCTTTSNLKKFNHLCNVLCVHDGDYIK